MRTPIKVLTDRIEEELRGVERLTDERLLQDEKKYLARDIGLLYEMGCVELGDNYTQQYGKILFERGFYASANKSNDEEQRSS